MSKKIEYYITEEDKELPVRELLKRRLKISSRLYRNIKYRGGEVLLNGKKVKADKKGEVGDLLEVTFPRERSDFEPQDIRFEILFEDEDLLIINKPVGYVVHPTKGHPLNTIANGVMKYMLDSDDEYKIRFINRLDMDTSGVLLVGKNPLAQDDFTKQANRGEVVKRYIAYVNGTMPDDQGTIDLPIGHSDPDKIARMVREDGDRSVTHYRVLERYEKGFTKVELELETGRTHQIRVHLSHLGYPIISDHLYGKEQPYLIERQALHASELIFKHPDTKNELDIVAPEPADIIELSRKILTCGSV